MRWGGEACRWDETADSPPSGLGYDVRGINWARLAERMMAATYNALFYGALIIAARALGVF